MAYQFNNEVLNAILLDLGGTTTYPQDIDVLNAILLQLGGTGGHHYMIDAYNELCTIQSVSSNHYYLIDALNAINIGGGGTAERFELPALVQLGANANPAWVLNPYFSFPENGISILAGKTLTIYGDTLVNTAIINNLSVVYTCDIGTQDGNDLVLSPTTANYGNHSISILIKNGSFEIGTFVISVFVDIIAPALAFKILPIGDSTLDTPDNDNIFAELKANLGNANITFIGTKGTALKHEAQGGWGWLQHYGLPPFFKGAALNIPAYFADNSLPTPNIIYIRLGVNDVFGYLEAGLTDANITEILYYADLLINGFLNFDANLKIIIGFTTLTGSTSTAWNTDYDESIYNQNKYIEGVHRLQLAYKNHYSNGVFNSRVDCSYEVLHVDRATAYLNGVHFNTNIGDKMLGEGLAPYINKARIGTEKITSVWNTIGAPNWYWQGWDVCWTANGNVLNSNGGSGLISKTAFWVVGKTYKVTVKVNFISGQLYAPYDAGTPSILITSSNTYVFYYTPGYTGFHMYSNAFNGQILELSVKEVIF